MELKEPFFFPAKYDSSISSSSNVKVYISDYAGFEFKPIEVNDKNDRCKVLICEDIPIYNLTNEVKQTKSDLDIRLRKIKKFEMVQRALWESADKNYFEHPEKEVYYIRKLVESVKYWIIAFAYPMYLIEEYKFYNKVLSGNDKKIDQRLQRVLFYSYLCIRKFSNFRTVFLRPESINQRTLRLSDEYKARHVQFMSNFRSVTAIILAQMNIVYIDFCLLLNVDEHNISEEHKINSLQFCRTKLKEIYNTYDIRQMHFFSKRIHDKLQNII